jgi:hypothetical protein
VRSGFQELPWAGRALGRLDAVVSQGWQATQPLIQPLDDLDALVLVGPLRDGQSAIGAVQLVVVEPPAATTSGEGLAGQPPAAYGRALAATLAIVQPALLRRMQIKAIPLEQAEAGLRQVQQQIAGIQRSIRLAIERYLQQLTGATFGSLEENQQFVKGLQRLLDSHGLRVRCPECGHPAILRCARNAAISSGAFVFDHYLPEGRTFHGGGRTLPALRTVAKPSRRKSSS